MALEQPLIEGRGLELGLKRGRKELAEEWKAVRRGWYVGGTEFKERMFALVEQPLRQGRGGSYSGAAKRTHGEAEAERSGMLETNHGGRRPLLSAEAERAAEIGRLELSVDAAPAI